MPSPRRKDRLGLRALRGLVGPRPRRGGAAPPPRRSGRPRCKSARMSRPRLLGGPGEQRLEILQRRGLEPEVVEGGHLPGEVLGGGLAVGATQRQGQVAAQRGEEARLLLVERGGGRRLTTSAPRACPPARTGTASSATSSERELSRGAERRSAQPRASGLGGTAADPGLGFRATASRPDRLRVEGHVVVAEVACSLRTVSSRSSRRPEIAAMSPTRAARRSKRPA